MKIRRTPMFYVAAIALVLLAGCSQKSAQNAPATLASSDSLLASSPVEKPQGQIEPQTNFQPQTTPATTTPTPAPAPAPAPKSQRPKPRTAPAPAPAPTAPTATVAAGTGLKITMSSAISSETATLGQEWSGSIAEAVVVGNMAPFPAGSVVHGVVDGVKPAERGSRAVLVLRITSIEANGKTHNISATADSIVAGSTRGRNVGAVAGSAAAGALIGRAIGGSGKGALIGGLLGGAAATGAVANSKGYQATVKEGVELVFRVDRDTRLNL